MERYGYTSDEVSTLKIVHCSSKVAKVKAHADRWQPSGWDIDYCLSEPVEGKCSLNFSLPIMVVVMICNLLKALSMLYISLRIKDKPLITVGDAIDSFLNVNDTSTQGMCLISKTAITAGEEPMPDQAMQEELQPSYAPGGPKWSVNWNPAPIFYASLRQRWYSATSAGRWYSCLLLFFTCIIAVVVLLGFGVSAANKNNGQSFSLKSLLALGIGSVHPSSLISGWKLATVGGSTVVASVLIANIPQPVLSFLYLLFNGVFTSMFLAAEWSDFAHERKSLRVSRPSPGQRSTYFLQLPYRYAIPLMILSGILHWSVSQSIFIAQVASFDKNGRIRNPAAISTCGFSPVAIIITLLLGTVLAVFVSVLGLRRYRPGIPLAGSCSAAISAACHGPPGVDSTAPLKWGVTTEEGLEIGHCAFSDREVRMPTPGSLYAGLRSRGRVKEEDGANAASTLEKDVL